MSTGEEVLANFDAQMKAKMPEECYEQYKKFSLCKIERTEEVIKTKGLVYYHKYYATEPYSNIEGCKNEFSQYNRCYERFFDRYVDLKNYVAEVEGNTLPFNRKQLEGQNKQSATYHFGFDKF